MPRALLEPDLKHLEALIDAYSLAETLSAIGYLCGEKSEHTATQWQDTTLAKRWLDLSVALDKLVAEADESGL